MTCELLESGDGDAWFLPDGRTLLRLAGAGTEGMLLFSSCDSGARPLSSGLVLLIDMSAPPEEEGSDLA